MLVEGGASSETPMASDSNAGDAGTVDPYCDTVRIRVLPESMLQEGANSVPSPSFDPYSTDIAAQARERPRRTLDDMRRLSEQIKRIREFARYDEPLRPVSSESKKNPK
jgi:hypothetical protein